MPHLSDAAKRALLRTAREAIACAFRGARPPEAPDADEPEELLAPAGAFVCLKVGGHLRGCVGTFEPRGPLRSTVAEMAHSAAFHDSRFRPLIAEELGDVALELSVLTPLRPLADPGQVEVGRHGLYIVQGPRRGVLLPQVATECGWDRETFLTQTCRKAGLPPDAWQKGAEIYVFEAEVFGEE